MNLLKAYELLESTPKFINEFHKVHMESMQEQFSFELRSKEEKNFYQNLEVGCDDAVLLWYENERKAFCLFVTQNEELEVEFITKEMNILWTDEDGQTEYDSIDETPENFDSFQEAVLEFIQFLENY